MIHVSQNSGLVKEATEIVAALAPAKHLRSLRHGLVDLTGHFLELSLVYEWTDVNAHVQTTAELECPGVGDQTLEQFVAALALDQVHALDRCARLSAVGKC